MRTGVRWPFLAVLGVLVVVAAGKVLWIRRELALRPAMAYDDQRVSLPGLLSPAVAWDRDARRAFEQAYAAWRAEPPALAQRPGTALERELTAGWTEMLVGQMMAARSRAGASSALSADASRLLRATAAQAVAVQPITRVPKAPVSMASPSTAPPDPELIALARRIATAAADDAAVEAAAGAVLAGARDSEASAPLLQKAVERLGAIDAPRLTYWAATTASGHSLGQYMAEAVQGAWAPGEQRLFWRLCGNAPPSAQLCDVPGVDLWLYHLLAGQEQVRRLGPESVVLKGDAPPGFLARRHLLRAWRLHPDWPEAAALMIVASAYDPLVADEPRFWLDQAVAAQFDYLPAYEHYRHALLSRRDDPKALLEFGHGCLATGRLDTAVPDQMWAALVDSTALEAQGTAIDWSVLRDYEPLSRQFAARVAQAPNVAEATRARSRWAAAAWRFDQPVDLGRALVTGGRTLNAEEFALLCPLTPGAAIGWLGARLALGQAEATADQAWRQRRWPETARLYGALARTAKGPAAVHARRRAAAASVATRLAQGQSVAIQPGAEPGPWERVRGVYQVLEGGAVRFSAARSAEIRLGVPLRTPVRLTGSFRAPSQPPNVDPGLFLTRPASRYLSGLVQLRTFSSYEVPRWESFEVVQTADRDEVTVDGRKTGGSIGPIVAEAGETEVWLRLTSPALPVSYSGGLAEDPESVWWDVRDLTLRPAAPGPAIPPAPTPHSGR